MADSQPSRTGLLEEVRALRARLRDLAGGEGRLSDEAAILQAAEFVRDVLWICDAEPRRFIYVSPAYERIWGRTCESLYQRPESFLESIHSEDRDRIHRARGADASDRIVEEQYRIVRPDGAIRWIRDRRFALRDASGSVRRLVGIAEDVTDHNLAGQPVGVADRTAELTEANDKLRSQVAARERAEQATRDSEERYRAVVEDQTELICRWRPDGVLTFVNGAYCRYFDKTREELLGRSFIPLIPEEDHESVKHHFASLGAEHPIATHEHRVIAPNGAIRWQQWSNRAVLDQAGRVREFQSVGRDITERRQAEEESRLLQTLTALIADAPDVGAALQAAIRQVCRATGWHCGEAWMPSADGRILECVPAWYGADSGLEAFRTSSESLTFSPNDGLPGRVWSSQQPEWIQDVSGGDQPFFRRAKSAMTGGLKAGLAVPIVADGCVLAVLGFYMTESRSEDARLVKLVSTVAAQLGSTLKHKRTEHARRLSEERHRVLVETAPHGIQECDTDGVITFANPAHARMYGCEAKELIGMRVWDLIDSDTKRDELREYLAQLVRERPAPSPFTSTDRTLDGRLIDVQVDWDYSLDEHGDVIGFVSVLTDITQREKAASEIRRLNEELEERISQRTAELMETNRELRRQIADRERAEHSLRLAAEIMYHVAEGVSLVRISDGQLVYTNPTFERIFGYGPGELVGRHVTVLNAPGDKTPDETAAQIIESVEAEGSWSGEVLNVKKDGTEFWTQAKVSKFEHAEFGTVFVTVQQDISERKRAAQERRAAEQRYRTLFEQLPDAVVILDPDTTLPIEFNDLAPRMLGYSREEFAKLPISSYEATETSQEVRAHVEKVQREGRDEFETTMRTKRGKILDVLVNIRVVELSGRKVFHSIYRDITERKRADEALKEMNIALANAMPGIARLGIDGRYVEVNDIYAGILGFRPDEMIGRDWKATVHPEDHAVAIHAYERMRLEGKGEFEARGIRKDAATFFKHVLLVRITDEQGAATGHHCFMRDVSERTRADAALRESERHLNEAQSIAKVGHWRLDPTSGAVSGSDELFRIFGLSRDEAALDAFAAVVHPDDRERDLFHIRRGIDQAESWDIEHRVVRGDGTERTVRAIGRPIVDENGRTTELVGTVQDITEHKRAEEALQLQAAVVENMAEGVDLIRVSDGEIVYANPASERIFGYASGALIDRHATDLNAGGDTTPEETEAEINRAVEQTGSWRGEIHNVRKDGTKIWTWATVSKFEHSGFGTVYLTVRQDITERKRAEQEADEHLRRLQRLSELSMTLSGDPLNVFKRVARIIGELLDVRVVCLSEIRGEELHFLAVYADGGIKTNAGHCPLKMTPCADVGRSRDILVYDHVAERFPEATFLAAYDAYSYCGFPALDSGGNVLAVTCLLDDKPHDYSEADKDLLRVFAQRIAVEMERQTILAQRARAEEALRESEDRFRSVFEKGPLGVALVGRDYRFIKANECLCRMVGYSEDELRGLRFSDITHPDDVERDNDLARQLFVGEIPSYTMEKRYIMKSGAVVWGNLTAAVLRRPDGTPEYGLGMIENITERKQAEERERLRQAELAQVTRLGTMGEMATGIAHELNQPLAAIANYAEACILRIRGRDPAHADLLSDLEGLAGQTERAGQIIRRLRDFVRRGEPRRSTCEINEIVREVVGLMEPEMRMTETALRLELSASQPAVRADSIQIEQVILNLVRNAVEAMSNVEPARRALLIRSATTGDEAVEVTIRDTGNGLDPEIGEQIFDAFFTTKPEGMGMGLSISRTIVEAHGGRLWAAANPGGGATFRFTLPISGGSKDDAS